MKPPLGMIFSWDNLGFTLILCPMGHRTCFVQDPPASDPSELYYLHPYTKSVQHFKEQNKLQIQQDGQEWKRNQEQFGEGKVESLNCKKWKSVCYPVVAKWRDILVDYFEKNHNSSPQVDAFANKKKKRFPKFYDDAWSEDWSEPFVDQSALRHSSSCGAEAEAIRRKGDFNCPQLAKTNLVQGYYGHFDRHRRVTSQRREAVLRRQWQTFPTAFVEHVGVLS